MKIGNGPTKTSEKHGSEHKHRKTIKSRNVSSSRLFISPKAVKHQPINRVDLCFEDDFGEKENYSATESNTSLHSTCENARKCSHSKHYGSFNSKRPTNPNMSIDTKNRSFSTNVMNKTRLDQRSPSNEKKKNHKQKCNTKTQKRVPKSAWTRSKRGNDEDYVGIESIVEKTHREISDHNTEGGEGIEHSSRIFQALSHSSRLKDDHDIVSSSKLLSENLQNLQHNTVEGKKKSIIIFERYF